MALLDSDLSSIPEELSSSLIREFQDINKNYFLNKWRHSQLDGGRFAEIVLRIIEFKIDGSYTPLNVSMSGKSGLIIKKAQSKTSLPESLRFHIPKLVNLIIDFRNKRNVAHPGKISSSQMDAIFVRQATDWILAELVRLETSLSSEESEKKVREIIEMPSPVVEDFGDHLKVLDTSLTKKNQIIVLCWKKYGTRISIQDILNWMKDKNKGRIVHYVQELDKKGILDFHNGAVTLTIFGLTWVEKNIKMYLEV